MTIKLALIPFILICSAFASDKPKVFVTGENSFQVNGPSGEEHISGTGNSTVAEGIKLLQDNCPFAVVNMRRDMANYIVSVTDDGSGAGWKGRRAVLFNPGGDLLLARSTRSLRNAIKDACEAMQKDWASKPDAKNSTDAK